MDAAGLIGWWRGQDSGRAEVGPDLVGSSGFDDGVVRRGFALGTDSDLAGSGLAPVADAVTVAAWVRPSVAAATSGLSQVILSRWEEPSTDDAARSWVLRLDPFGTLVWSTDDVTSRRPVELRVSAPSLFDGAAHHVAATRDATTMTIYVDGVTVISAPSVGGPMNAATTVPVRVGSKSGAGPRLSFDGVVDEPTVFARSLSAPEVAALFGAGSAGLCVPAPVRVTLPNPSAIADDAYGYRVAVDRDTVVAARSDGPAGTGSGSVVVSTGSGPTWTTQAVLAPGDGAAGDGFGSAVAIDGDTIVVGAPFDADRGANAGSAYVFVRSGGVWTQQAKLLGADTTTFDGFGSAVDVSGDTVVVGAYGTDDATGSAYVFRRSGTTWSQEQELRSADALAGDLFANSVSIDEDRLLIGVPNDTTAASVTGSARVFTRTGATWTQQSVLLASDAAPGDFFGWSVSLDGTWAIVGAHGTDDVAGSAYVFGRTGTTWIQQAELQATDRAAGDLFGLSVAISGDTALVGAPWDADGGSLAGSSWAFRRTGDSWSSWSRPVAGGAAGDRAGIDVALDGDVAVIGSPGSTAGAPGAGVIDIVTAP